MRVRELKFMRVSVVSYRPLWARIEILKGIALMRHEPSPYGDGNERDVYSQESSWLGLTIKFYQRKS